MKDENKIYIVSNEKQKPIKITFEGFPIKMREDKCIIRIPLSYISDVKMGVISQDNFTPEQWEEIEKWVEEENKNIDLSY